jgi:small-conductance mechanosensitive channel
MLFCILGIANNTQIPNTQTKEQNQQLIKSLKVINETLPKFDFYIKYKQYQKLLKIQENINILKNKIKALNKTKNKNISTLENLKLQLIAYQKQLEIISGGKQNLFDSLISITSLPKPFTITNPFEIFNAINYTKKIEQIISSYQQKYKELDTILQYLKQKLKLQQQLSLDTTQTKKDIQDFKLAQTIYLSKLEQLKLQAILYKQTIKQEENRQINKLITLIITIFASILFFTLIKLALKKYTHNIKNIYLVNKIINILNFTIAVIIIAFFYIDNATYLITILGFASAGIAIAMKDWFMNVFGWFVILSTGNFKTGDRIKVVLQNGNIEIVGDIIDITISRIVIQEDVTLTTYTTNRRAGRIIFIPNNIVFTNPIFNYTHHGLKTVWDGIDITITFDSNYKKAEYLAKEITKQYSKGYTDITRKQLNKLRSIYNIKNTQVEPRIFTFIGEYGVVISCWYLNNYNTMALRSKISAEILDAFSKEDDIKIAYNTLKIKTENEQIIKA